MLTKSTRVLLGSQTSNMEDHDDDQDHLVAAASRIEEDKIAMQMIEELLNWNYPISSAPSSADIAQQYI